MVFSLKLEMQRNSDTHKLSGMLPLENTPAYVHRCSPFCQSIIFHAWEEN